MHQSTHKVRIFWNQSLWEKIHVRFPCVTPKKKFIIDAQKYTQSTNILEPKLELSQYDFKLLVLEIGILRLLSFYSYWCQFHNKFGPFFFAQLLRRMKVWLCPVIGKKTY